MRRFLVAAGIAIGSFGWTQSGVAAPGDLLWSDRFDRARLDDRFLDVAIEGRLACAVFAMSHFALQALSPLDGRYSGKVDALRALMSEAAFMRHRVKVEVEWLIALSDAGMRELPPLSREARGFLRELVPPVAQPVPA